MAYEYSELDKKNLGWFKNDFTRTTLISIRIQGRLRSLCDLQIDFCYPITAIAGQNGSGKTTILALAACAYSNLPRGYIPPGRKISYYRHSDFFVRTDEDSRLSVQIGYQILHDKWVSKNPTERGPGAGWKYHHIWSGGGRWSYKRRLRRNVVYLGIDRIVPDVEKSVSKGYRWHFQVRNEKGWEDAVKVIVGRILGREYKTFNYKEHSKYRLPVVSTENRTYSGFNMGAGEEALFGLFSVIKELPDGSLILIDEIELGLHEEAQIRLIQELKVLCNERKLQVICTTHSTRILDCLPPEGRIFLEKVSDSVLVIPSISSTFASGKLSGYPTVELDVLVEDEAAKMIIEAGINPEIRSRIRVLPVGSSIAVMRHLAARYKEARNLEVCAILDGDKFASRSDQIKAFLNAIESPKEKAELQNWAENHVSFLPGDAHPEAWIVKQREGVEHDEFQIALGISSDQLKELLIGCRLAGKHNELFYASQKLNLDTQIIAYHLIRIAFRSEPIEAERINKFIGTFLS